MINCRECRGRVNNSYLGYVYVGRQPSITEVDGRLEIGLPVASYGDSGVKWIWLKLSGELAESLLSVDIQTRQNIFIEGEVTAGLYKKPDGSVAPRLEVQANYFELGPVESKPFLTVEKKVCNVKKKELAKIG